MSPPEGVSVGPLAPPVGKPTASGRAGPAPEPPLKRPFSMHGRLYFGDKQEEQWSIADPTDDRSYEAITTLYQQAYPGLWAGPNPQPETLTVSRADLQRVLLLAEAWIHIGNYELGIGIVGRQLRDVRAALRKMGRAR